MKTKVFVCSSSSLNYIKHPNNIEIIPSLIKFSEEEAYNDFLDIKNEQFFNRLYYDQKAKPLISIQNYAKIALLIHDAQNEGYEQFLFLIACREFGDLKIPVGKIIQQNPDLKIHIFDSETVCYPLAYMALEASRMFDEDKSLEEVIAHLEFIKQNNHLYFFKPDNLDCASSAISIYHNKKALKGNIYSLDFGGLTLLKNDYNGNSFTHMISLVCKNIDKKVIPFIVSSQRNSNYVEPIESTVFQLYPDIKVINNYPISIAVGTKLGPYSIGFGYINLEDESSSIK